MSQNTPTNPGWPRCTRTNFALQAELEADLAQLLSRQLDGTLKTVTVYYLDLDKFKQINDLLGHDVADKLIEALAERISANIGRNDRAYRPYARGDEFVIVMTNIPDRTHAYLRGIELEGRLSGDYRLGTDTIELEISTGAYWSDSVTSDLLPSNLIKGAELAMQESKSSPRDELSRVTVYGESNYAEETRREERRHQLVQALDAGELQLQYQPCVSLTSGQIVGAEAALGKVFEDLHNAGERARLVYWTLQEASSWLEQWNTIIGGASFRLSINVYPSQLVTGTLYHDLTTLLDQSEVKAQHLRLEILETRDLPSDMDLMRRLEALRELGISLALDDFGVGFSSISRLAILAEMIDQVKLDMSLIAPLTRDQRYVTIVGHLVAMIHDLGIQALAEGVETNGQAEILKQLKCDSAQGYLYSRAVPAEEFTQLLSS